jgi:prevent-host-death family protein
MSTIGAFEAKTHFSALLERVEHGERVIITKHGKPVARLIPINDQSTLSKQEAIKQLKKFSASHTLGDLDWKALRDEGRK